MGYLLFVPRGPGPWPLIVALHGKGQEGDDDGLLLRHGLPRIADERRGFPFAVLAPQMPVGVPWGLTQFAPTDTLDPELWGDGEDAGLPMPLQNALQARRIPVGDGSLVASGPRLYTIYMPRPEGRRGSTCVAWPPAVGW